MLFLAWSFVESEEKLRLFYLKHTVGFEVFVSCLHFNRFPALTLYMKVAFLNLRISFVYSKINFLPAITNPANIPHM